MENQPLDRGGQWNLYGLNGERLGTYTYTFGRDVTYISGVDYDTTLVYPAQAARNIYFAGKLIQSNNTTVVVDAQGSVRANESGQTFEFYPYGEEMGTGTTNSREKFATYTRESNGLDYANQRYYSSTYGAFTSADPLHETATTPADPSNPGSWNRFAYTAADPINLIDPLGTSNCAVDSFDDSGDSDDGDVNLGSHCGSGFQPTGNIPNGATRCYSRPGLIFTFNGVPSTCQDGIIVAVDTAHVTQPVCSITLDFQSAIFNGDPFQHTFIDLSINDNGTVVDQDVEAGPSRGFGGYLNKLKDTINGGHTYNTVTSPFLLASNGGSACTELSSIESLAGSYPDNTYKYSRPYNSNSFTYSIPQYSGTPISLLVNAFGYLYAPGWGLSIPKWPN